MRERMKKKKNMIIGGLLAVVFLLSVGYAAFATSLNISGTANTSSWIIKITNIREKTHTGGADTVSTSFTDLSATFSSTLTQPGDSVTYEVTVENQGNIDASLKKVTKTFSNNQYIDVTYSGLLEGQMLYKQGQTGSSAVMEVTVTFKDIEIESLTDTITSNITISLDFEQEGNNVDTTKKYLITYDSDGGTVVESKYFGWNDTCLGCVPEPTKLGYNFTSWHTGPGGAGETVNHLTTTAEIMEAVSKDESDDGLTLYANWQQKSGYKVYYNAQNGSDVYSSTFYWLGQVISGNNPSKGGHTFLGWYTSSNGTGMKVDSSTKVNDLYKYFYGPDEDDPSNEMTIYATWQENTYTIAFNSRGGSEVSNQTAKWTEALGTLPTPTQEGYTFDCWRTQSPHPLTKKPRGIIVTPEMTPSEFATSDTPTLYAYWIQNE